MAYVLILSKPQFTMVCICGMPINIHPHNDLLKDIAFVLVLSATVVCHLKVRDMWKIATVKDLPKPIPAKNDADNITVVSFIFHIHLTNQNKMEKIKIL